MNKRRLLKLANLLEADAKNRKGVKFDLDTWGQTPNIKKFVEPTCSTTACAFGLAAVSGAFKRDGLDFNVTDDGYIIPTINGPDPFYGYHKTLEEMDAAEFLFEIDNDAAEFLFHPDKYPKGKRTGAEGERFVAKRIRDFVAGKVAPPTD